MENRLNYIDAAKGIGITAIVIGHTLPVNWLHFLVHGFHVPLFFFISALFLNSSQSCGLFIRKRFKRLMLPYYFAAVLSILAYVILGKLAAAALDVAETGMSFSVWKNMLGMVYANTETELMHWNTPLWFLPCLFSTSVIVFLTEKYFVKGQQVKRILVCALSIGLGTFLTWLQPVVILPLQLQVAFHMVLWMEAGVSLRQSGKLSILKDQVKQRKRYFAFAVLLFILASFLAQCNSVSVKVKSNYYGHYPLYLLTAALFIAAVIGISIKLENCRGLIYLGRHSLIVLLFHKFPILLLETVFPQIKNTIYDGDHLSVLYIPLLTAFSTGACLLLGKCLQMLWNRMSTPSIGKAS